MNRAKLAARISQRTHIAPRIVLEVMAAASDEIIAALARGEKVSQTGFGTFTVKSRRERECFLPTTGERIIVGPKKRVVFQPGKAFTSAIEAPTEE